MTYPEKPYAGLALLTDLDGTLLTPEKTVSPEDAAAIAKKMYWNTDVLDFTDDDIMMIDADVMPEPVPTVDEFARGRLDFATEIVRMIRESDEPNEVIARLVDSSLLYYIDHPDEPIQGAECVD